MTALRRRGLGAGASVVAVAVACALAAAPGAAASQRASSASHCRAGKIHRGRHCTSRRHARRRILAIARQVKHEHGVRAVILRVDSGRHKLAEAALGNSMTGTPATTRMHFRIGSIAIPYLTTILLQLQDEGKLKLDDKLSKWFPKLPRAHRITLRMLANSTSGYYDYAQGNPVFSKLFAANAFRRWTQSELLQLAFARGFACDPGACFNYAHANFIILGMVIHKVTGRRISALMRRRILRPLGLRHTHISSAPAIPSPVLHAYNRRTDDGLYEDSSFWDPSWSIGRGVIQIGTIDDVARSAAAIGSGRLISRRAHREQIAPPALHSSDPSPKLYYGLGLIVANSWIVQNPMLSGYVGLMAYLPSKRISVAIETTDGRTSPESKQFSVAIFDRIAAYLAPGMAPDVPS